MNYSRKDFTAHPVMMMFFATLSLSLTTPTDFALVCCNSRSPAATCAGNDVVMVKMLTVEMQMTCAIRNPQTQKHKLVFLLLLSYQMHLLCLSCLSFMHNNCMSTLLLSFITHL